MPASPYCPDCWRRKQTSRARYCDACGERRDREGAARSRHARGRRESDMLKAREAAAYRARTSVLAGD